MPQILPIWIVVQVTYNAQTLIHNAQNFINNLKNKQVSLFLFFK